MVTGVNFFGLKLGPTANCLGNCETVQYYHGKNSKRFDGGKPRYGFRCCGCENRRARRARRPDQQGNRTGNRFEPSRRRNFEINKY